MTVFTVSLFAQNSRGRNYIKQNISEWGGCRNVAITDTGGDLALNGKNDYAYTAGIPQALADALEKYHDDDDYIDDVREVVLKSRYRCYPVLDEEQKVVGTLSRYHLLKPRRKQVVLVDHNELSQTVPGIEQAEILAIVDHHRLADIQTRQPINVRNEPVGSTNTIITSMYQEHGVTPSPHRAGLCRRSAPRPGSARRCGTP